MSSDDNFEDYIGADLISVDISDRALNKHTDVDIYEGGIIFVNLETSNGTLQFAVYNEHNGYYGHDAKVTVGDKTIVDEVI